MRDIEHVVSDAELNVHIQLVEATNIVPPPWNSPDIIGESLELPVQRACWLLRELGVETTASTANHKNIGNTAGIAICRATLSNYNLKQFTELSRRKPSSIQIRDDAIEITTPIAEADVTAKAISDALIAIIDAAGLKPQPAKWAESKTAEELLLEALEPMRRTDQARARLSGREVLNRLMNALTWDAEHGLMMEQDTYEQFRSAAELLEQYGNIVIIEGKPTFQGVRDPHDIAVRSGYYVDPETSRLWQHKKTKEYYEQCLKAAAPEASVFDASGVRAR